VFAIVKEKIAALDSTKQFASALDRCVLAVNDEYCSDPSSTPLCDGDEVSFIPPVSGG
jgi:molybdopterin converting factor small subunit